jgi:hypothetical protein
MGAKLTPGAEPFALIRIQATLDNWQNFHNSCTGSLMQGYRSASYRNITNNRDHNLPPPTVPLSEYIDYNNDVLLFGHAPEPIEEDKTWRLLGEHTNGTKTCGGAADLIIVLERLKLLQTGTVALQATNL